MGNKLSFEDPHVGTFTWDLPANSSIDMLLFGDLAPTVEEFAPGMGQHVPLGQEKTREFIRESIVTHLALILSTATYSVRGDLSLFATVLNRVNEETLKVLRALKAGEDGGSKRD